MDRYWGYKRRQRQRTRLRQEHTWIALLKDLMKSDVWFAVLGEETMAYTWADMSHQNTQIEDRLRLERLSTRETLCVPSEVREFAMSQSDEIGSNDVNHSFIGRETIYRVEQMTDLHRCDWHLLFGMLSVSFQI